MDKQTKAFLEDLRIAVEALEATTEPSRKLSMKELRRRLSRSALAEALACSCPENRDDCPNCYPEASEDN